MLFTLVTLAVLLGALGIPRVTTHYARKNERKKRNLLNIAKTEAAFLDNVNRTRTRMTEIVYETNSVCIPMENAYDNPATPWDAHTYAVYRDAAARAEIARWVMKILDDNSLTPDRKKSDIIGVYEVTVSCGKSTAETDVAAEATELILARTN